MIVKIDKIIELRKVLYIKETVKNNVKPKSAIQ